MSAPLFNLFVPSFNLLTLLMSPKGPPLFPKLLHLLLSSPVLHLKFTLLGPLLYLPNSRRRPHNTLPYVSFQFRADASPFIIFLVFKVLKAPCIEIQGMQYFYEFGLDNDYVIPPSNSRFRRKDLIEYVFLRRGFTGRSNGSTRGTFRPINSPDV